MSDTPETMGGLSGAHKGHTQKSYKLSSGVDVYKRQVYDGLQKIKFEKPRAEYKAEHEAELKQFYAARRKLDVYKRQV